MSKLRQSPNSAVRLLYVARANVLCVLRPTLLEKNILLTHSYALTYLLCIHLYIAYQQSALGEFCEGLRFLYCLLSHGE